MIWAICVAEDVSIFKNLNMDILTGILCNLERPPFLLECKRILHPLLVLRTLSGFNLMSMTYAAVICDVDEPCTVNTT